MELALIKKIGSRGNAIYMVMADNKHVFYILATASNKPDDAESYWNGDIGIFPNYSLVEASALKVLDPGCSEAAWLELLVVRGVSKEDLEAKLTLMLDARKDDTTI